MTPYSPEERAKILALHPSRTPADLDRLEALAASAAKAQARGDASLLSRLAELEQALFPRLVEALEAAAPVDEDDEASIA